MSAKGRGGGLCGNSNLLDDFQTRQTIQNHVLQDRDLIPTLQHNLAHSPAPGWFTTLKSGLSPRGERFRTKDNPLARGDKRVARSRYGLSVKGHNMHGFTTNGGVVQTKKYNYSKTARQCPASQDRSTSNKRKRLCHEKNESEASSESEAIRFRGRYCGLAKISSATRCECIWGKDVATGTPGLPTVVEYSMVDADTEMATKSWRLVRSSEYDEGAAISLLASALPSTIGKMSLCFVLLVWSGKHCIQDDWLQHTITSSMRVQVYSCVPLYSGMGPYCNMLVTGTAKKT
ncbi:hypothetical protein BJV77DRAFT_1152170 [Russula vinacea]|nr:hypothetical protein BJV77DRAFT_1152170 [Russula vinacea]